MSDDLQEDAIGALIVVTVVDGNGAAINLSGSTTKKLIFRKPNKKIVEKDADYFTDGSDGKLKYTTVSGDLKPDGVWRVQAYIVKSGVIDGRTKVGLFEVRANIE